MSSASLRGLLCLAIAFAMFAGVSIWAYQQSYPSAPVSAAIKSPKEKKQTAIAVFGQQPPPKFAKPARNQPKPAVPQGDEPVPFNDPPRFFQKGGGKKGFGRTVQRASLSERLGVRLDKPSEDTVLQLGIAETDGLVIEDVRGGSLAESAGMKVGDILLTLDRQNVPSDVERFHFQLENVKTNEAIDAVVLRDGKMETLKGLVLPEAPQRSFPFQRKFFDN